ncbi:interleukin-23 receptor [Scomber japonicus]|uniref:interleukin-23 receptor n=1 Tax=Scomber japonicus TaxID=13676 RepID=UPI0023062679|nr:interleukin-23 receptor [Scomber japonicus]
MNLASTIWRCIITLLCFSIKWSPLLFDGSLRLKTHGYVTVEPASPFLMGSNLTVYCHITDCQSKKEWLIFLKANGRIVYPQKSNDCTAVFKLSNVGMLPWVECRMEHFGMSKSVNGLGLLSGLPPDTPKNIVCETAKESSFINCSWERGQETYVHTTYNVSLNRENGTRIYSYRIQDAEEISIPRAKLADNTKYQLIITAYNHFGASQSDPFTLCIKDIVIPETPHIMQIQFENKSIAAMLQWKTESSQRLKTCIRHRKDKDSWEVSEGTELSEGLIKVDGLEPLTEYEFQMKTCNLTSGLTQTSTPMSSCSSKSFCSKWSPSQRTRSPGRGPSQQLDVWRILGNQVTNAQMVTVLWKPPPPEDYSGELQQYKIFLDNDPKQKETCPPALSRCLVHVPPEVQAIRVSVVTLYGTSPPADVPLRPSGVFGLALRELAPAAHGNAVLVSWSWSRTKQWLTSGGELLYYVIEWMSVPPAELQWQKLDKDQNNTCITGLTAGVRYNISLYAVTTRGVSAPSSGLVYSKEQKPVSGPSMSVLVHKASRILIQFDELAVEQQRGFITNYTIYLKTLATSNKELRVTVPASVSRMISLDCPEGILTLQMTASTSAGEGPRGNLISSQPANPAVTTDHYSTVVVIVCIITFFAAIIANLLCWSCVRKRIKQRCISWGPSWLVENLPKLGHSNAIRLLEQGGSERSFSSTQNDPPLSPISLISQEDREDMYPTFHVEVELATQQRPSVEMPLLDTGSGTMLADSHLEHVSYKPQIITSTPLEEEVQEAEEEQRDMPAFGEEDSCLSVFEDLLSTVEVDFSDSPLGLTLSSVNCLLWPKTPETTSVLNKGVLLGRTGSNAEEDSRSMDSQQAEIMTPDQGGTVPQCAETSLTGGYFPQVSSVSINTTCHTQR